MVIDTSGRSWTLNHHAVTLTNIGGTFYVYNSEMTLLPLEAVTYLPGRLQWLRGLNLAGRHTARAGAESEPETSIFGVTIGLTSAELCAPFRV
jgi:hypothetical protein